MLRIHEEDMMPQKRKQDGLVLVRTYSAGVHFGRLVSRKGKEVVLKDARRIWYWKGANTLNEIALHGCAAESKISEPVPSITLTEAIELLPISAEAKSKLDSIGWGK